ncbi:hypothetical protein HPB51_011504 [Rhipicephalus microplus]|uniref:Ig-like domain-containing protein n=1 Tax=Rhipicephalus microplus TaxID=6941 RepID=A0A9J6D9X4_RHIMP|nr:hypothetical protein HPB51_011504 [Rhipicephalus microplus]
MSRVLQARRGAEVTIQCHVTGDEPISISWGRDGSPLAPFQITNTRFRKLSIQTTRIPLESSTCKTDDAAADA